MSLLDVHFYDGKIDTSLLPDLIPISQLTSLDKKTKLISFYYEIEVFLSLISRNVFSILMNRIGEAENYDPTNNLRAEDLLYYCSSTYTLLDDSRRQNFISLLDTQLEDMLGGFCSQGRCSRLFQLILSFNN